MRYLTDNDLMILQIMKWIKRVLFMLQKVKPLPLKKTPAKIFADDSGVILTDIFWELYILSHVESR